MGKTIVHRTWSNFYSICCFWKKVFRCHSCNPATPMHMASDTRVNECILVAVSSLSLCISRSLAEIDERSGSTRNPQWELGLARKKLRLVGIKRSPLAQRNHLFLYESSRILQFLQLFSNGLESDRDRHYKTALRWIARENSEDRCLFLL